jgi:sterol 24-C-methyltransferase
MEHPNLVQFFRESLRRDEVKHTIENYQNYHDLPDVEALDQRMTGYTVMVNHFYDLVTDFFVYGWGQSFHFAPRFRGESFEASLARYQHYLAHRLRLAPGMTVLDVGCGVGGPMRSIARFSGAHITGVNNNAYQIERAKLYNQTCGLDALCDFIRADFMHVPAESESFDAAISVEATCHAPSYQGVFSEVFRLLKKGGQLGGYEWGMTDRYDPGNNAHQAVKKDIQRGTSLPNLVQTREIPAALERCGFEVLDCFDAAARSDPETPWYLPLAGYGYNLKELHHKPLGRWLTNRCLGLLELIKVVPAGAQSVSGMLNRGADALVRGGEMGIFTPMFFFLARKP